MTEMRQGSAMFQSKRYSWFVHPCLALLGRAGLLSVSGSTGLDWARDVAPPFCYLFMAQEVEPAAPDGVARGGRLRRESAHRQDRTLSVRTRAGGEGEGEGHEVS